MKGDFSRATFRPEKHYRTVLQQQGRVTVDADPNEESEILNQRQDATTTDVIGPAGRPKGQFTVTPAGADLAIGKGTLYLDGIPCLNDANCSLRAQPFLPLGPAGFPDLQGNGTYAVYLRAFERLITAVEDRALPEKALGGADTCARSQLVWQVRLVKINPPAAGIACSNIGSTWKPAFNPGHMTAQTVALPAGSSPCSLPPQADYRSLENQLYRVEIHKGGPFASATFKWSRENGSVLTAVLKRNAGDTQDAGPILSVSTTGRDADIGFGNEQFVELLDDVIDLTPGFQPLSRTKDVRAALSEIELHAAATLAAQFARSPKLRRWDQTTGDASGILVSSPSPITLENGVAVSFDSAGDYKPGDYWLIPARTAIDQETGFIEWPTDSGGNFLPQPSRYQEHTCLLTVVNWDGLNFAAVAGFGQCVPEFPPLTNILATDVHYTPGCSSLTGVVNVQQALDALCTNSNGACTIVVRPGPGWEAPILALPPHSDAEICFPVGEFPVSEGGVSITGLGDLKITGAGLGTHLVNRTGERCMVFGACASVTVRDLAATCSVAGPAPNENLLGALSFFNCGSVEVDSVRLECGDSAERNASCLTVSFNDDAVFPRHSLRVRACNIIAGKGQYGILVTGFVPALRVHIEDNEILCTRPERNVLVRDLAKDAAAMATLKSLIASQARVLKKGAKVSKQDSTVQVGDYIVAFKSAPPLRTAFLRTVEKTIDIAGAARPSDVAAKIGALAKTLAADPARWKEITGLTEVGFAFQKQPVVGLRGICLAGTLLQEARILNNTIVRFREGIHIGLSHRGAADGSIDVAESVVIQNNRIETELLPGDNSVIKDRFRRPFAVYVGNVNNLLVLENHAIVDGAGQGNLAQVGVLVFGFLGPRILIRGNRLDGFRVGVSIGHPAKMSAPGNRLWMATENFFSKALTMVDGELKPALDPATNVNIP